MKIVFYRNGETYYYVYDNKEYFVSYVSINKVKEKLSMVLSMVIFGTIGIFVKYIGIPSGVIAATRGIIGSIVIFVVMLFAGHKIEFKKLKKKLAHSASALPFLEHQYVRQNQPCQKGLSHALFSNSFQDS
mgnify:CR=1 FL=1